MSYTNVREFKGGKQEWIDAGLPIEGKHSEIRPADKGDESARAAEGTINASTTPENDAA